jgi:hypothetical protein
LLVSLRMDQFFFLKYWINGRRNGFRAKSTGSRGHPKNKLYFCHQLRPLLGSRRDPCPCHYKCSHPNPRSLLQTQGLSGAIQASHDQHKHRALQNLSMFRIPRPTTAVQLALQFPLVILSLPAQKNALMIFWIICRRSTCTSGSERVDGLWGKHEFDKRLPSRDVEVSSIPRCEPLCCIVFKVYWKWDLFSLLTASGSQRYIIGKLVKVAGRS